MSSNLLIHLANGYVVGFEMKVAAESNFPWEWDASWSSFCCWHSYNFCKPFSPQWFFSVFLFLFLFLRFICLLERGKAHECVPVCMPRGGTEWERESPSRLLTELRARPWAPSQNPKIRTWAKIESWPLKQLSHPSAPFFNVLNLCEFWFQSTWKIFGYLPD